MNDFWIKKIDFDIRTMVMTASGNTGFPVLIS